MKKYTRARPFVAVTRRGTLECCMSSSNQPTKRYITRMIGPFKTFRGARFYRLNPIGRSINQIETLAREVINGN
jgi:hypothetical protein